jgi:hypothetical protein
MEPDPDPDIFVINLQDANKKLIFSKTFFCLLLFEGTFTSFFKDKSKRSHKTLGISRCFLLFLLDDGTIREVQKHVNPDPEHWFSHTRILIYNVRI